MTKVRPRSLALLIAAVDLAAVAVLLFVPSEGLRSQPFTALLLIALGFVAGIRPVRLPGLRINLTVVHPLVLVALGAVGPMTAILVNVAAVFGAAFGRKQLPPPLHLVFNVGSMILCTGAAWLGCALAGGQPGEALLFLVAPLAAAAILFFVANTLLLTLVISLETGRPLWMTLRSSCLWLAVHYLAGYVIAFCCLALMTTLGPLGVFLATPLFLLLRALYFLLDAPPMPVLQKE